MSEMYQLPPLPYGLDELEPVISKEALDIHYNKHHRGYVTQLNAALEKYQEAKEKNDLSSMILLQSAIQFHGGGHWNHSFFWNCLAPKAKGGGVLAKGPLLEKIEKEFGSYDRFSEKFTLDASAIQGSGWCYLGFDPVNKRLQISTTANHGILAEKRLVPLLVVDVWEHAYYLQYKNLRIDFLRAIWQIFDWKTIESRYLKIMN